MTEIKSILKTVDRYGYGSYIQVDLTTLRSQTYYTGMVFEIYTAGLGYPIGGGGRYDRLLQHFGRDYPATGFALGVERLLLSLPSKKREEKTVLVAGIDSGGHYTGAVIEKARNLREKGIPAIMELRCLSKEQAAEIAREKGAGLIWCREAGEDDGI